MSKLSALFVLSCLLALAMALPEARLQQRQLLRQQQKLQHPYLFFSVPRGRANAGAVVQGFEVVEDLDELENDDDDDDADEGSSSLPLRRLQHNFADDDDDDDDQMMDDDDDDDDNVDVLPPTQMMVARDQAGAIMVPDGIIEIEGQSVVDEKTGKAALLVPRAALDAIPDGAVVALMERSASDSSVGEERANRVIVRRRKNAGRRNVRRRRRGGRPVRRRAGGRRRRGNRRNVRVIRPGGNRRRGNQRRRVALQG
ncbi:uncharacterized protein LOC108655655 [Drosophila navojoa]|uniref:uncharacterized protein LOC108655655 n=1 Tax=Drosophila navojoa TaxID=7232 RepID=UPI0011BDF2F1|nr:uncharacterized protein LOC108655655 [Drosophila navojoa]